MHIKIIELKACPNYRQNSECHRDVMHIKITELNTCPNCRQNLGPTQWLLGLGLCKFFFFPQGALQFLLQFVFRNSISHHMVSANIMILLFSPEINETKRFHYIWIPL